MGAVALQFGKRTGVIIGLDRDVLDPDTLLVLLRLDDRRDVELQPGEVELAAAPGDLPLHRRAEIVDVEFRHLLGIVLGLDMDVTDVHRHARLLREGSLSRAEEARAPQLGSTSRRTQPQDWREPRMSTARELADFL